MRGGDALDKWQLKLGTIPVVLPGSEVDAAERSVAVERYVVLLAELDEVILVPVDVKLHLKWRKTKKKRRFILLVVVQQTKCTTAFLPPFLLGTSTSQAGKRSTARVIVTGEITVSEGKCYSRKNTLPAWSTTLDKRLTYAWNSYLAEGKRKTSAHERAVATAGYTPDVDHQAIFKNCPLLSNGRPRLWNRSWKPHAAHSFIKNLYHVTLFIQVWFPSEEVMCEAPRQLWVACHCDFVAQSSCLILWFHIVTIFEWPFLLRVVQSTTMNYRLWLSLHRGDCNMITPCG